MKTRSRYARKEARELSAAALRTQDTFEPEMRARSPAAYWDHEAGCPLVKR